MNNSYEGIGYLAVSVPAGTCEAGMVCKVNAQGQAELCTAGEKFAGVCDQVKKGMAAVQVEGFAEVPYSGSVPACGFQKLAADGNGGVAVSGNAQEYLVLNVDVTKGTITMKL